MKNAEKSRLIKSTGSRKISANSRNRRTKLDVLGAEDPGDEMVVCMCLQVINCHWAAFLPPSLVQMELLFQVISSSDFVSKFRNNRFLISTSPDEVVIDQVDIK